MSAGSKRPGTRTASLCVAAEAARVTHSFKVVGNGLHRNLAVGRYIRSATFAVGGHNWCIKYYPYGIAEKCKDYVAVFLEAMSRNTEAAVFYDFRLVNQATGLSTDLETLGYLKDGCLEIECDVTVIKGDEIDLPPSDLVDSLGKLLESEERADVKFKVKEELFQAHKIVLAMRSPIFKAELARDKRKRTIVVEDMEPHIFKALLHFIYTDSLPAMDHLDGNENDEMAKCLLVAAERYGLERMKLMCESMLYKRLSVQNVASTLVLADQCHCSKLKDACIRFISSSERMDDVLASQGFEDLKTACPALSEEILEKSAKPPKI
ncbi:unnamed protein product [Urochloa decumbens]|uniref:Uncharacterized protein n=1 Tax=Urochloa decumbens TaxID=240449 RepID=A0ABC9BUU2_9POAL